MDKRYYIALIHTDRRKDKLNGYDGDLGKARAELARMIQDGAPDGFRVAVMFSTKKLIKIVRLHSAAELAASVDQLNARDEGRQSEIAEQASDVLSRFAALKTEAQNLGITLPGATLVVVSDKALSTLDPVGPNSELGKQLQAKLDAGGNLDLDLERGPEA